MNITKAFVLTGKGCDIVSLYLEGVTPPLQAYPDEIATRIECDARTGETWVKENFPGVPVEVVTYSKEPFAFSKESP